MDQQTMRDGMDANTPAEAIPPIKSKALLEVLAALEEEFRAILSQTEAIPQASLPST